MTRLVVIIACLAWSEPGVSGDREFDGLVRRIEARYETDQVRIPLFGLVNFFVKVVRPAGTTDLKLAVFEDMRRPLVDGEEFTHLVAEGLGPAWHPFVRVESHRKNEWTSIYADAGGNRLRLLIASMERQEATLIRVHLNTDATLRWVSDPVRTGRSRGTR
jgi:hypothetical protein